MIRRVPPSSNVPDLTALEAEPNTLIDIELIDGTRMRVLLTRPASTFDLSADVVVESTGKRRKVWRHELRNAHAVTGT